MSAHKRFVITFKEGVSNDQIDFYADEVNREGGIVTHRYGSVINGFAAELPDQLLTSFQNSDIIDYIEPEEFLTTQ